MTVKLSSLKADVARERDGDWVDIPDLPGVRLKVRSFFYGPFQAAKTIVEQRWARKYGKEPVPIDESLKENGKLYAQHLLLGWEGFDVEYSSDVALETLIDPAFRDLQDHIRYASNKVSTNQAEFVEDAGKNSGRPSAGTSSTAGRQNGSSE